MIVFFVDRSFRISSDIPILKKYLTYMSIHSILRSIAQNIFGLNFEIPLQKSFLGTHFSEA